MKLDPRSVGQRPKRQRDQYLYDATKVRTTRVLSTSLGKNYKEKNQVGIPMEPPMAIICKCLPLSFLANPVFADSSAARRKS